ncbi:tetratricopeptide repeat protein [Dehalococcoidia bacterium]|nr:tetratricopeptide repeat protein [Dehalococcoidia bacterium]MCL0069785.1 tetratricopeptide repeat protein [Dehalococcoidia bacterium]
MFPSERDPKRERAEDTLDQGLDLLEQGNEEEAGRYFFKSIEIDPTYADGYNHLANIAWRKRDWKQAEGLYRKALEFAEPEVKGILKGEFWGMLESRPYMRAFHGLGLTARKQGRFEEAISIFRQMLKLNPNDNQGVRYLMGSLYHQLGNLEEAGRWYERNGNDPHNLYNYGLALIQQNKLEKAARILVFAIFANPYIAPMLLGDKLPKRDWWHGISWAEPEYAEDYIIDYSNWWEMEELPLVFLRAVWNFGEVKRNLKDFIATRRAIKKAKSGEDRVSLGRAGDALSSPERARKLAGKIYRQFERERHGWAEF